MNSTYDPYKRPHPDAGFTQGAGNYGVQQTQPVTVQATAVPGSSPDKPHVPNDAVFYGNLVVELDTTAQRHSFIRKVYTILTLQLLLTFGTVALFTFFEPAGQFVQERPGLFYAALAVSFVVIIGLSCFSSVARKHPWGLIFLFVFTVAESLIVGFLAAQFAVLDVIMAIGVTFAIVFGLTLFACQTKYDFTGYGPYLFVALLVLVMFSFILIFVRVSRETRIVFAVLAVLLFSMFLVYDTQLVMGGNHKQYQFEVDDYVFAALNLYLDIITIFLYILILFGGGGDA